MPAAHARRSGPGADTRSAASAARPRARCDQPIDHRHQRATHQDAGQEAGQEQVGHRDLHQHGIHHHDHRGRDDRADDGRGCAHGRGEGRIEAFLAHRVHLDHTQAGGIGLGDAAHAGEDHARDDVDMRQTAADVADQRRGELEDAVGDAGAVEQVAGQHEQRDGDQHEAVQPGAHALHDDRQRDRLREDDARDRGQAHRERHRHLEDHQQCEQAEQDPQAHSGTASVPTAVRPRPAAGCRPAITSSSCSSRYDAVRIIDSAESVRGSE